MKTTPNKPNKLKGIFDGIGKEKAVVETKESPKISNVPVKKNNSSNITEIDSDFDEGSFSFPGDESNDESNETKVTEPVKVTEPIKPELKQKKKIVGLFAEAFKRENKVTTEKEPVKAESSVVTKKIAKRMSIKPSSLISRANKKRRKDKFGILSEHYPGEEKVSIVIAGDKGSGKTVLGMSGGGSICVLSYDAKSFRAKKNIYEKKGINKNILAYNCIQFYDRSSDDTIPVTANDVIDYSHFILDEFEKKQPRWILFDGTDILAKVSEMKMRFDEGLGAYQGITKPGLWNKRNDATWMLHKRGLEIAGAGVLFTMYPKQREVIDYSSKAKGGSTKKYTPNWKDTIQSGSDIVILVENASSGSMLNFKAYIDSSKVPQLRTAEHVNVTDDYTFLERAFGLK